MKIGYWGIRGKAEPLRMLLAYLKTDYTEYNPQTFPEWFAEKKPKMVEQGLPFSNLPYVEDGEFLLTESGALPIYVAGKADRLDLFGTDFKDRARHEMLVGVAHDMIKETMDLITGKTTPEDFITKGKIQIKLKDWNKFLGDNDFSQGKDVRFADLLFTYFVQVYNWALARIKREKDSVLAKYPKLVALVGRVENLEGIKQYLTTDVAKRPIYPPSMMKI